MTVLTHLSYFTYLIMVSAYKENLHNPCMHCDCRSCSISGHGRIPYSLSLTFICERIYVTMSYFYILYILRSCWHYIMIIYEFPVLKLKAEFLFSMTSKLTVQVNLLSGFCAWYLLGVARWYSNHEYHCGYPFLGLFTLHSVLCYSRSVLTQT